MSSSDNQISVKVIADTSSFGSEINKTVDTVNVSVGKMKDAFKDLNGGIDSSISKLKEFREASKGGVDFGIKGAKEALASLSNPMKKIDFSSMFSSLIGAQFAVNGIHMAFSALKNTMTEAIHLRVDNDQAISALSALIAMNYNLHNEQGQKVEGSDAFAVATKIALEDMKHFRSEAIRTGVDMKSIVDVFKTGMSSAAESGLKPDQWRVLAASFSQVGNAIGIKGAMLQRDVTDLMMGIRDTKFSRELGLEKGSSGRKEFDEAKLKGQTFEFLQKKLENFAMANEQFSNSMGGFFGKTEQLVSSLSLSITEKLAGKFFQLKTVYEGLFSNNTKEWTSAFQPIVDSLNIIIGLIGQDFVNGVKDAVEWIRELGKETGKNDELAQGFKGVWELVKSLFMSIGNIIGTVFTTVGNVLGLFGSLLTGSDNLNTNLTTTQKVMIAVQTVLGTIAIAFGFLSDLVGIVGSGIQLAIGGAITIVADIFQKFFASILFFLERLPGFSENIKNSFKNIMGDLEAPKSFGRDLAFAGNTLMDKLANSKNTAEAIAKIFSGGLGAVDATVTGINGVTSTKEARNFSFEGVVPGGGKTGNTGNPESKNHHVEKEKGGKTPAQQAFEDDLNALDKYVATIEKQLARNTKIKKDELSAQLISTNQYYDSIAELSEDEHNLTLKAYDDKLTILKSYLAKEKDLTKKQKYEDQVKATSEKIENTNIKFKDDKDDREIHKNKDLDAVSKKQLAIDEEYLTLQGNILMAGQARIDQKFKEILKSKDLTSENRVELAEIKNIEEVQNRINALKAKQSVYSDTVLIGEKALSTLKSNNYIGELDYLSQLTALRQKNFAVEQGLINSQISELVKKRQDLEKTGADVTILGGVDNEISKLKASLTDLQIGLHPLQQEFRNTFVTQIQTGMEDLYKGGKKFNDIIRDIGKNMASMITSKIFNQWANKGADMILGSSDGKSKGIGLGGTLESMFNTNSKDGNSKEDSSVSKMATELTQSISTKLSTVFDGVGSMFNSFFSSLSSVFSSMSGSSGSSSGGSFGSILSSIVSSVPAFADGTDNVSHDMLALVHKGERITPAKFNSGSSNGNTTINQSFNLSNPTTRTTQSQMGAMSADYLSRTQRSR